MEAGGAVCAAAQGAESAQGAQEAQDFAEGRDPGVERPGGTHARADAGGDLFQQRLKDAGALAEACQGFAARRPDWCARDGLNPGQRSGLFALAGAAAASTILAPTAVFEAFAAASAFVFSLLIGLRFSAALNRLLSRPAARSTADDAALPGLTLLVPLYREAHMADQLVAALLALDYPQDKLQVIFLTEADDPETNAALHGRIAGRAPFEILPAPPAQPRTKPKALNYGLAFARGEIIGVFDAEDRPDPGQPREAAQAFLKGPSSLAVVQAPLLVHNRREGWLSEQFGLEYAIHFLVWLPFIARLGWPLALGGTSNYFRARHLRAAGGWDPFNVTEDADLGCRLARMGLGARTLTRATWEEAPVRLRDWFAQRTRWMKGYIQTFIVLNRRPFDTIAGMGLGAYAAIQLTLGGAILAAALHLPLILWILIGALTPLDALGDWRGALLGAGYLSAMAAALAAEGARLRPASVLTLTFYWPLSSLAVAAAVLDLVRRPHHWAKTPHAGSSVSDGPDQAPANARKV